MLVSNDGTTTTLNLFALDLIQQDDGSQTRTLLVDGLGSARVEMVGNAIETTTTYEPYGKLLAQSGSSGTTYGYTGEQYDTAASLVYLRARYYNPNLKVFMSRDPFPGYSRLSASQNGYSYAYNNPVNLTDYTGENPLAIPTGGGIVAGCIASGVCVGIVIGVTIVVIVAVVGYLIYDQLAGSSCPVSFAPRTQTQTTTQTDTETLVIPYSKPQTQVTPQGTMVAPSIPTPTPDSGRKDIALAWDPMLPEFTFYLNEIYNPQGRKIYNWFNWTPDITRIPDWSGAQFRDAASNAAFIHFELSGVDILLERKRLTYEQLVPLYGSWNEPPPGRVTLWELAQIKSQGLCQKTLFYRIDPLTNSYVILTVRLNFY